MDLLIRVVNIVYTVACIFV